MFQERFRLTLKAGSNFLGRGKFTSQFSSGTIPLIGLAIISGDIPVLYRSHQGRSESELGAQVYLSLKILESRILVLVLGCQSFQGLGAHETSKAGVGNFSSRRAGFGKMKSLADRITKSKPLFICGDLCYE
jgi:hypothetical protein